MSEDLTTRPSPTSEGTSPRAEPPATTSRPARNISGKLTWRAAIKRDWQLYSLAVLPLLFFLVFRYLPMKIGRAHV